MELRQRRQLRCGDKCAVVLKQLAAVRRAKLYLAGETVDHENGLSLGGVGGHTTGNDESDRDSEHADDQRDPDLYRDGLMMAPAPKRTAAAMIQGKAWPIVPPIEPANFQATKAPASSTIPVKPNSSLTLQGVEELETVSMRSTVSSLPDASWP